jgi:hypothetical protein
MTKEIVALAILTATTLSARKFYHDDPIEGELEPMRVEQAERRKLSDYYDFFYNTFAKPGEKNGRGEQIPAGAVNTLGEVPDGAWHENRHGRRRMTIEELVRGPDRDKFARGPILREVRPSHQPRNGERRRRRRV